MKKQDLLKAALVAGLVAPPLNSSWLLSSAQGQDALVMNGSQILNMDDAVGSINTRSLPMPGVPDSYDGSLPQFSQNVEYDDHGDLIFFVIDGAIYDHCGYLIADTHTADFSASCDECLFRGITQVGIVAVPGTCDKYFIIAADRQNNSGYWRHALGYSILDFSKPNPHHPDRLGRVLTGVDLLADPVFSPLNSDISSWSGTDAGFGVNNECMINLHDEIGSLPEEDGFDFAIYDTNDPINEKQIMVTVDDTRMYYYEIRSDGIVKVATYSEGDIGSTGTDFGGDYTKRRFTGTCAFGKLTGSGTVYFAMTKCFFNNLGPSAVSIYLFSVDFAGSPDHMAFLGQVSTLVPAANYAEVSGLCFSPSGTYLYFIQRPTPFIGVIYVPTLTFTDLAVPLGITDPEDLALGRLVLDKAPSGSGTAIYVTSADRRGCILDPDAGTGATWLEPIPTSGTLNAPPLSHFAEYDGSVYQHAVLPEMHNFSDQQLQNLADPKCCGANYNTHTEPGQTTDVGTAAWSAISNPFCEHPVRLLQDLVIPAGSHITSTGITFQFAPGRGIIVEPGGSFKCYDCTLEGRCEERWHGIEAHGSAGHGQEGSPHPTYQARVDLINCQVRNADIGLYSGWRNPPAYKVSNGAVLTTYGTTFHNCREMLRMMPYQNFVPGTSPKVLKRNLSRFINTTATVDADYPGTWDFQQHAYLWKVDGILFSNCKFQNLVSDATADANGGSSALGYGIHSLDANYRVLSSCYPPPLLGTECPPGDIQRSVFRGLDHGIHALNATTARGFETDRSLFENNICGVYTAGTVHSKITRNQFVMGLRDVSITNPDEDNWLGFHRAAYTFDSYAFSIDDNELSMDAGAVTEAEGIVVGYNRDHNDYVFRNSATNIKDAYVGEGICADLTPSFTPIVGLQFICNFNQNDEVNFWSRKVNTDDPLIQPTHTIRANQGNPNRPADNHFDQWPDISVDHWDFQVTTTYTPINYWHQNSGDYFPTNYTNSFGANLNPEVVVMIPPNNCTFKIPPLVPDGPDDELVLIALDHAVAKKLAYANTRYLYEQLIDGGNTDEVVGEITSSWPQDAWALRDYLLNLSPYLSTEALKDMVKQDIMPDAMIVEICAANPEATQQNGFMAWLQEESGYPLPQYMANMIMASWNQQTFRGVLEAEMGGHHAEMTQAVDLALEVYQRDSTIEQIDSMRQAWHILRSPAARYAEALLMVQEDSIMPAIALVDSVAVEHNLTDDAEVERQRMKDLLIFLVQAQADDIGDDQLDSAHVADLEALIDGSYDRPAWWAQNLLCFGYGHCRPTLTGGEREQRSLLQIPGDHALHATSGLTISPNPASTWVAFNHHFEKVPDKAVLVVTDVTGRKVVRFDLATMEGQSIWDTRDAEPGSYVASLMNGGRIIAAEQFIVRP